MSFEDAIKPASGGTIIDVEASPGAKETKVPAGYNEWRKRIMVKLKAPPERGKANEELIGEMARLFNVSAVRIEITSGATDSRKSLKIQGMAREDVIRAIRGKV